MSILAVVGAINVDLVISAPRLPGPGETVVGQGPLRSGGGKGANAAVAAARLGAAVVLIGAVGSDEVGAGALAELEDEGVDVTSVARLEVATGVALIVVDEAGENQIAVGVGANGALTASQVRAGLAAAAAGPGGIGCVLVSTEIPDEAVEAAVGYALDAGLPCVLNPAPVTAVVGRLVGQMVGQMIDHGPILSPNRSEAADLAALVLDGPAIDDPVEIAGLLSGYSGAPVVMTLGAQGAVLVGPGLGVLRVPAGPAAVVRDTTGAGDTFNGALAAGLASGLTLEAATHRAVLAASLSVGETGARAGMPTAEHLPRI